MKQTLAIISGLLAVWGLAQNPGGPVFVDSELPVAVTPGKVYTLSRAPYPAASLMLFENRQLELQGVDYTLQGNVITFTSTVPPAAPLVAFYRR